MLSERTANLWIILSGRCSFRFSSAALAISTVFAVTLSHSRNISRILPRVDCDHIRLTPFHFIIHESSYIRLCIVQISRPLSNPSEKQRKEKFTLNCQLYKSKFILVSKLRLLNLFRTYVNDGYGGVFRQCYQRVCYEQKIKYVTDLLKTLLGNGSLISYNAQQWKLCLSGRML
jgi:hypothetical protein